MIYQHPLAYLVGLEGLALLRAWAGDFDREFVAARLSELRRLLDDDALGQHPGVEVLRGETTTGYQQWAESYDEPRNGLFDFDEPVLSEILEGLPKGVALDAACGTGRFAAALVSRGHRVIGVDSSSDMLARARGRVPAAQFAVGHLEQLPLSGDKVDLVVCALAMSHLKSLEPAMAEFARVLRPGGHLLISDPHHELIIRGSVVHALGPNGEPGLVTTYRHTPGDFLRAALPLGFEVRRCEEPGAVPDQEDAETATPAPTGVVGPWQDWPWSLLGLVPEAAKAAWATRYTIIWHFQLGGPDTH